MRYKNFNREFIHVIFDEAQKMTSKKKLDCDSLAGHGFVARQNWKS